MVCSIITRGVRNSVTCCKYVSVACELFVFVSGVQPCVQICTKITSPPCKTHAAYICSGSARLKDLRQTCGMHVTEVRVFSRLRNTCVRSLCFREECVVQICGQQWSVSKKMKSYVQRLSVGWDWSHCCSPGASSLIACGTGVLRKCGWVMEGAAVLFSYVTNTCD